MTGEPRHWDRLQAGSSQLPKKGQTQQSCSHLVFSMTTLMDRRCATSGVAISSRSEQLRCSTMLKASRLHRCDAVGRGGGSSAVHAIKSPLVAIELLNCTGSCPGTLNHHAAKDRTLF